ncbi:pyridoxamine 5'-phosphate oxidase family protein [Pseudonocardia sp. KRD291]|uniref:pyridoxamine 5'-phosphate oxidase family protein n=1 Tax=Pseudonocardia sp. KRD291 TaxID=2792007 RepID=UPI001C4A22F0|nr:pyridoxamine 5'-phosphate oxidase family protein [Pseudonocardia sp. KRD291]MBW0102287.1 pyridoxamine 5'-phosphate oxidase family protein [Pseudonocardia sp. KRD291]
MIDRLAFHPGELTAQREAGLTDAAERVRPIIASTLPGGASDFLRRRRMLVVGALDRDGRAWATGLHGPEGFLSADDPSTLRVAAGVPPTDPLAQVLQDGADVGTLAIDLELRRRLRINGRWRPVDSGAEVDIHQAFGNCPKYIQTRAAPEEQPAGIRRVATRSEVLGAREAQLVSTADTFFVATAAPGGADVSHRGGNPGFVRVVSLTELTWPDYDGNAMLMTVGNLRVNPAAGLLFPDWRSGATLQLSGTAEVRPSRDAPDRPATGRETAFRITGSVWVENAFPSGWSEPAYSRFN